MLDGQNAELTVALRSPVQPTAFTVHHVAPDLTFEAGSAPRHISLDGCTCRDATDPTLLQQ